MKSAVTNVFLGIMFGLPYIVMSQLIPSHFSNKLLTSGSFVLLLGVLMGLYFYRQRKVVDRRYYDEREEFILLRAMGFTFLIVGVMINTLWAHYISIHGNEGFDYLFWLMAIFWGTFLTAYTYLRIKL